MKEYKIAIIGGHGLVAITLLKLLCNSFYKDSDITLFGSKNSEVTIGERSFNIVRIDEDSIEHYDVVFMCCSNEISEKYQRGRHTTNHALWFQRDDITIIDTPGVREMLVPLEDVKLLSQAFPEFSKYECAYNGCTHIDEPGCKVKEALEDELIDFDRYESYVHLFESIKERTPQWSRTKFRKNKQ